MTDPLTDLYAAFPALRDLEPAARDILARAAHAAVLPPGAVAFRPGETCNNFLMVLSGAVTVRLRSESGHELVLYRVQRGETCLLTTSCLFTTAPYDAEGVVEEEVHAIALPRPAFDAMIAASPLFRRFVFAAFGVRLTDIFAVIDAVAFQRMDKRLAQWLLTRPGDAIETTHAAIAGELGTAREVVSRLLKDFERRHFVAMQRGRVTLTDRGKLGALAKD